MEPNVTITESTSLLADINTVFPGGKLSSEALAVALSAHTGQPITKGKLARQLRALGISPKTVRIGGWVGRGYDRSQLAGALARYGSPKPSPAYGETMTNIVPFNFEANEIRTLTIDGEVWIVAKDVAAALGYAESSDISSLISKVPPEWKGPKQIVTPGGVQEMATLSEQGLYFFLARSDKPKALPFQKWVAGDVMPSIRKTGSYAVAKSPAELLLDQAQILVEQERRVAKAEQQARLAHQRLDQIETACDHFTIIGYARMFRGQPLPLVEAARIGGAAARMCKGLGVPTGEVPDPRFGRVNTYPRAVLDAVFESQPNDGPVLQ